MSRKPADLSKPQESTAGMKARSVWENRMRVDLCRPTQKNEQEHRQRREEGLDPSLMYTLNF